MRLVLLRGLVASPVVGAATALLFGSPWVLIALFSEPELSVVLAGFALGYGTFIGLVIGVPSTLLLVLLKPVLRTVEQAVLASMAVSATVGLVAVLIVGADAALAMVAAGVCAVVGAAVGRWVVLGPRSKARPELHA
jgi:hypothetical protein